ncbi:hypothetical protein [Cellulosimicrobium arenosum]|uniref:Uncharacterized protein n=1 Tax=Cellulosimicrobium arenosum TaxID=2708133 RepID=A0A927G617_9MICO|nr:hypothetical protein [Cellulosimicrobium arenosum]MBD8077701.1 hypothetical protein [Cellulosimicrobium arenosum]
MPIDSNGIWQYEETDAEATASDLLNLLATSTSDAVSDVNVRVDGLTPDTGRFDLTPSDGITVVSELNARRVGDVVEITGYVSGPFPANTNTYIVDTEGVPEALRPTGTARWGTAYLAGNLTGSALVRAEGSVGLVNPPGASAASAQFSIIYTVTS